MCRKKSCSCKFKKKAQQQRHRRARRKKQKGGSIFTKIKNTIEKKIDNKLRKNAFPNGKNNSRSSNNTKKSKFDLHSATLGTINKIFGKRGMVPPPYHYLGPGNDLKKQLKIGPKGNIQKYYVKPYNVLDQIASKHDVCYQNRTKSKSQCDYEMLRNMKGVGPGKIPKGMGRVVNAIIGGKLMLGV